MAVSPHECFELPRLPAIPTVRLPGGIEIADFDIAQALQPALAPLAPVLIIVDAVVAVFNVLETIPSLNPIEIADALVEAAAKQAKLLRLVPQLSIPFMVLDTVDAIIYELGRFRDNLARLQTQIESIDAARARADALGDPQVLLDAISCADGNVQIELDNQLSTMQILQKLFAILEVLLGLIGLGDSIPDFSDFSGSTIEDAIEAIDELIDSLQSLRDLIPV